MYFLKNVWTLLPFFDLRFSKLQETIGDKCIDLVQEYGDQIIEIILKEEFDPEQICAILTLCNVSATSTWGKLKFIYSEKATKFCEISTRDLTYVVPVKSTVEILQNFVAFSEYMNFNGTRLLG